MAANLMSLNDNKAGMSELDTDRINSIIMESSKGSKFYENQQRKQQQLQKRIDEKLKRLEKLTAAMIKDGEKEGDALVSRIRDKREFKRCIIHVDMDAFYAAVEMRDDPSLRSKPMAVGGMSMLSTSNYIARRFGVRAAMPGFIAKKLCPELIIVHANFEKYTSVSREVRGIMAKYDPNFAPMSLDEAYLDITDHVESRSSLSDAERTFPCQYMCSCDELSDQEKQSRIAEKEDSVCRLCMGAYDGRTRTFGTSASEACREIRWRIFSATQLTASAGLAPNTLLSKIASDKNKPNGQYEIDPTEDSIALFIRQLPVRKIPGVGTVSEQILKALGVNTCADIYEKRGILFHLCTPCNFQYYMRIAVGEGDSSLDNDSERKSMSVERTFNEIGDAKDLLCKCRELSNALSEDLREADIKGRTVTLKMKLVTFEIRTRAQTLSHVTSDAEEIYAAASDLLRNEINSSFPDRLKLRLMGVRLSGLVDSSAATTNVQQLSLERSIQKRSNCDSVDLRKEDALLEAKEIVKRSKNSSVSLSQATLEKSFFKKRRGDNVGEEKTVKQGLPTSNLKNDTCIKNMKTKESGGGLNVSTSLVLENPSSAEASKGDSTSNENGSQASHSTIQEIDPSHSSPGSPVFCHPPPKDSPDIEKLSDDSEWNGYSCPVCFKMQLVRTEAQFHAHLDFCLSRGAISQAIREVDDEGFNPNLKRKGHSLSNSSNQTTKSKKPLLKYFSKIGPN